MSRYYLTCMLYGSIRKAMILKRGSDEIEYFDSYRNVLASRPMSKLTKVCLIGFGAMTAIYGWPYFVMKDLFIDPISHYPRDILHYIVV